MRHCGQCKQTTCGGAGGRLGCVSAGQLEIDVAMELALPAHFPVSFYLLFMYVFIEKAK